MVTEKLKFNTSSAYADESFSINGMQVPSGSPKRSSVMQNEKVYTKQCNKILTSTGTEVHYIDKWCRFIIPFLYFFFIVAYWGYYLGTKESHH